MNRINNYSKQNLLQCSDRLVKLWTFPFMVNLGDKKIITWVSGLQRHILPTFSWCLTEWQSAFRKRTRVVTSLMEQEWVGAQHTHRPFSTYAERVDVKHWTAQDILTVTSCTSAWKGISAWCRGQHLCCVPGRWAWTWPSVHSDRRAWSQPDWGSHTLQTAAWTVTPEEHSHVLMYSRGSKPVPRKAKATKHYGR